MSNIVVVIDDEIDVVHEIATLLDSDGYTVIEAGSGSEALAKVRSEHPWLLVIGETLPD